ncbi:MAG: type II toxin-antitoxin system RelE/ParE family toxin [Cryomorphaceae bacterium]
MKLKITRSFSVKLNEQVNYIAKDKPEAARAFKNDVINQVNAIPRMPYINRKSIFFDREDIRDLVVQGYVVVYRINKPEKSIEVFGFTKWENDPFE